MSKFLPFTVYIRVVPDRANGKKFEYIRDLQKIAGLVYDELSSDNDLELARPGGGQHRSFRGNSALSGLTNGTAVTPQIGQRPSLLTICGFMNVSGNKNPIHPNKPIIHSGSYLEGSAGGHGWSINPFSINDIYVKSLKTKAETAVQNILGSTDWDIFKIEINGIIYGEGGYHYPR